ncbi:MAG: FISUMP domain-containing protein [Bacteroidales bacterium]|nr:FISUMP domain-containing protein [Bacteroidales bacterium]
MRKLRRALKVVYVIPWILLFACSEKENETPTVEVVYPADGSTIMQGETVNIRAEAGDVDGSVKEVTIYIEGEEVASAEASSLVYAWSTAGREVAGYVLSATARDNEDASVADNITVLVDSPGGFNPALSYGTVSDMDGNSYGTIEIGQQIWMAENLKVTKYADGSAIPLVTGESEWEALSADAKAYCWYDNQSVYGDTTGALYTWAAAMNGFPGSQTLPSGIQGVCPDGWHLPSDAEWKVLESFLGMSPEDADRYDWRGSDEGGQLKEIGFSKWEMPNAGASNSSGFTAVPGGFRGNKGVFYSLGHYATFWTASDESGTDKAWYRTLYYNYQSVYRQYNFKNQGFSVRCVKDAV